MKLWKPKNIEPELPKEKKIEIINGNRNSKMPLLKQK